MMYLLYALLIGVSFVDNGHRFGVDLPEGWRVVPSYPVSEEESLVTFQREFDGILAQGFVRVFPVGRATINEVVGQMAQANRKEPGFKLLGEGLERLGGMSAVRRRYQSQVSGPQLVKFAEDVISLDAGVCYVVHFEALAEVFDLFTADFMLVLNSFKTSGFDVATGDQPQAGPWVGTWAMRQREKVRLRLLGDGTFDLDGTQGTYVVNGPVLTTVLRDGQHEDFTWAVYDNELALSNDNLGKAIRYRRLNDDGRVVLGDRDKMLGIWQSKEHTLDLRANGEAFLGSEQGTFQAQGGVLSLHLPNGRFIFQYELRGEALTLHGERFGKATTLFRAKRIGAKISPGKKAKAQP